ncbi:MAG TPA: hypothetical protein VM432_01555, partial [Bdellovibrionales bacterium]|nr:hypothetical protein [Bdellovibrionales bacterium]
MKAFFLLTVFFSSILAMALPNDGKILGVYTLPKPTASGFNVVVEAVLFEGQEMDRRAYYLAEEKDGVIVRKADVSDSQFNYGYFTKAGEFHRQAVIEKGKLVTEYGNE